MLPTYFSLAFCHLFPVWQIGKWHIYYQKVETWQRIYKMKSGQTFPWKLRQNRLKRALMSEKNKREKRNVNNKSMKYHTKEHIYQPYCGSLLCP